MARARTLAVLLTLLGSCGEEPAPSSSPAPATPGTPPGSGEAAFAPEAPSPGAPVRVFFDLARHLARAERWHGDARVIDLGDPSGHQHTLGGWRTRTGETALVDGASVALLTNVTGHLVIPLEAPDRCRVTMRARGVADGRASVYLDDETVGHVALPTDGSFSTVHVDLPPERCTPGEHDLRLRVARTGALAGRPRVGLAIDWLRVGPADDPPQGPPALGGPDRLVIPAGWTLAYPFEVPASARLRAAVRGPLALSIERDGRAIEPLERGAADARGGAGVLDLDLGRFAGEVVRLRLRAAGGEVSLEAPAVVVPAPAAIRPPRRVRHALVYLTDTLRADRLRVYAPRTRVETPGLSAWARRATAFLAGHTQENWTKPSCATLLSGLYPWEHQATTEDAVVPDGVELLSERLRAEGLHTGAFVANGFVSDRFGFRQGWGLFRNYVREGRRNQARFVAADVLEWLDARPTDRGFFLYVHTIDPHVPYSPPREDLERYDAEPYEGPVDFGRDRALLESVKSGALRLNARDRVRLEALYDGEISYHDRHFASVMEGLERRGLADDTIVVFTADHGEEFWDHGSVGHGHSVFEELIRVPLIVRWPGVTDAGGPDGAARIDAPVGLVDVMPTILDALGLPIPDTLSGRSLAPMLRGALEDAPPLALAGFMDGWRAIVVGRLKLVQRTPARWMLYDLAADPGETTDLAATRPLAVRYLRGLLGLGLAAAERPPADRTFEAARTAIDAETRAQLEALGYAGASRAPTTDGAGEAASDE
ncbi:MAG: sulfatase [Sandaracinaceae bacterium]|nr:sulfatase [Sandaracinaceae bacterium]